MQMFQGDLGSDAALIIRAESSWEALTATAATGMAVAEAARWMSAKSLESYSQAHLTVPLPTI